MSTLAIPNIEYRLFNNLSRTLILSAVPLTLACCALALSWVCSTAACPRMTKVSPKEGIKGDSVNAIILGIRPSPFMPSAISAAWSYATNHTKITMRMVMKPFRDSAIAINTYDGMNVRYLAKIRDRVWKYCLIVSPYIKCHPGILGSTASQPRTSLVVQRQMPCESGD